MILPIFSVVGEALNFGARRMETIMRVAWLPVVLLLVLNMVTLFAYVSVVAGRLVTFEEMVPSFQVLQYYGEQAATLGWEKNPQAMTTITVASLALHFILIASFMAPLIRLAGVGEQPAPGVVRVPFGADQLRFILSVLASFFILGVVVLGPMLIATNYTAGYIGDALSQIIVTFPNDASLHTIELTTKEELANSDGTAWIYYHGIPLLVLMPIFVLFWALLTVHFHPKNRGPNRPELRNGRSNTYVRIGLTLIGSIAFTAAFSYFLLAASGTEFGLDEFSFVALIGGFLSVFYYLQLRVAPFPGVAVCRKSMKPGRLLRVTQGWNILRLFLIFFFLAALLIVIQVIINQIVLGQLIGTTVINLFEAVASYTKFTADGVQAPWVLPAFVGAWNLIKILANVFWAFFSYGVLAGLLGRLYRESER